MTSLDASNEVETRNLCHLCVQEEYLSDEIRRNGEWFECSYCRRNGPSYLIEKLADRIETAFDEHYSRSSEGIGEPVVEAIRSSAGIPQSAAEEILQILDERQNDWDAALIGDEQDFSADTFYEKKAANALPWMSDWRIFTDSLMKKTRFFGQNSAKFLASLFKDIDRMAGQSGRLVFTAGPGTSIDSLYRARMFQSPAELEMALCSPVEELGPPPWKKASAGRMNAEGIAVFYGTDNPQTAISEVRPPVGSMVAVARFEIIRPLRLLNLPAFTAGFTATAASGSIFDPTFARRLGHAKFLQSFSELVSQPILPSDEKFDYVPTQAVADFLATQEDVPLDGIIFNSVQAEGKNVVLFHKAALVQKRHIPEGTRVTCHFSSTYEGENDWEYRVVEETPTAEHSPSSDTKIRHSDDPREPALRFTLDSLLEVHKVEEVQVATTAFQVKRWGQKQCTPPF